MGGAIVAIDQDQGAPSFGSPGVARNDLWLNRLVTARSTAAGNISYSWALLDQPVGSATTLANATAQEATFTPDLPGSYRLQLITNGGGPGNIQILIAAVTRDNAGAPTQRGWRVPAFGEVSTEGNFGGQDRGWAETLDMILEDIRNNLGGEAAVVFDGADDPKNIRANRAGVTVDTTKVGIVNLSSSSAGEGTPSVGSTSATVGGGVDNDIGEDAEYSTIGGGDRNAIDDGATAATIGGGSLNSVGAENGTIFGGLLNSIGGDARGACITGGVQASAYLSGQCSMANGAFVSSGDAQHSRYMVKGTSEDGSPTTLLDFTNSEAALASVFFGSAGVFAITAKCVATRWLGGGCAMFIHELLVSTAGGVLTIEDDQETHAVANGEAWTIAYSAVGGVLRATFTGDTGSVRALVSYDWLEVH